MAAELVTGTVLALARSDPTRIARASRGHKAIQLGDGEHMAALRAGAARLELAARDRGADSRRRAKPQVRGGVSRGEQWLMRVRCRHGCLLSRAGTELAALVLRSRSIAMSKLRLGEEPRDVAVPAELEQLAESVRQNVKRTRERVRVLFADPCVTSAHQLS